ncbi:thiaminase II [Rhodophyticola sp. CCM32]|uniref:thiaminase II n=1 Tax=Rhodophyticola sp. CCM32 TaxID=2916397 RepID=UPI00107F634E|nr:thiaminase II [Rhodophyticola sp. CCM32]QBY00620.1 thiaminase II [Rhodophyticola sp. CCM32]
MRERIFDLPFNRELAAGRLSRQRFQFYMIQDALYLEQYSRALAIASAKAPDANAMEQFARSAQGALTVERALHEGVFQTFGIASSDAARSEPSPTCYGYTNFLLTMAHQASYEELVAAVLPCFWIYWDVGNRIAAETGPANPYQAWIETYSDPSFGESVDAVIAINDAAADKATEAQRVAMLAAFKRSVQYEWMFWDSAYREEQWPVIA